MKIYYIANIRFPTEKAHGIQLAKMCEAMIEQGADVTVVVPNRKTVIQAPQEFYGLRDPLKVIKLPVINTYAWGRAGYVFGSLFFMFGYLFLFWWKRFISREKFIIYTADMDQFSFVFIRLIGVPYFSEIHDAKKWSWPFAWFFNKISGVITINHRIKESLIATFDIDALSPHRVLVYPNGIDIKNFDLGISKEEARKTLGLPLNIEVVLYAGQFHSWKGLEIFAHAPKSFKEGAYLYIVGGTVEQLKSVSGEKDFPKNVVVVGYKNYKEMPLWLAASDVLIVLGTRKNEYSFLHTSPMKIFEYMAARRPIVASDTPAIRQIVGVGEVLFYAPDDAHDMASKVNVAILDGSEIDRKVLKSYERVKEFAWEKRAAAVFRVISDATN